MGDWFQVIVDKDASLDEARQLSSGILNWLVDEGIVEKTVTDCVLSKTGLGHRAGQYYWRVVEHEDLYLRTLITNGLDIVVDRTVFHPGQAEFKKVCMGCGLTTLCGHEWMEAADQWFHGERESIVRCASCGYANPITEWSADPPWGFGNLGFLFWNWPKLNRSFIDELARRLGHRIAYVAGKL